MTELAADFFRSVGPSDAIANDAVLPFYLGDQKLRISIARVDGRLYAFDDLCTCTDEPCPLSGGLLSGTTIMCQCHGSRFDIRTGAVVNGPATEALNRYEVQEVEGTIQVVPEVGQPWVVNRVMTTAAAATGARGRPVGYAALAASLLVVAGGIAWVLRRRRAGRLLPGWHLQGSMRLS
jgi:3-phenylpropionate/trans-cinnamate dioxygenase ferredoxin component